MPVLAIKSEQRCKLCRSDHRSEIDDLLEKRSLRKKNESGETINLPYVLRALAVDYAIDNPTAENVKVHWQKHCEQVSDAKKDQQEQERADILAKIESGEIELEDIDEAARKLFTLGYHEILERAKRGEKTGITVDHVIKFGDLLTKRRHNEKTEQLFDALGGAISQAMGGGEVRGELPPPDEILGDADDGEFVDA